MHQQTKKCKFLCQRAGFCLSFLLLLFSYVEGNAKELDVSGFARLIAGHLDTEHAEFKGYDDSWRLTPDSLIGLHGVYSPHEKFSVTGQLVLSDTEDDQVDLEWLYLTYRPVDSIQIKAGKLRAPFFALSDVSRVGYAYPWVNLPQQVYNAYVFDTFEGVDVSYGYSGKSFEATFEVYTGQNEDEVVIGGESIRYTADNMRGIIAKINFTNLELRASRLGVDYELDGGPINQIQIALENAGFVQSSDTLVTSGSVDVSQVGIVYDNIDYFARAERVEIKPELQISPAIESYYVTAGMNLSPFVLHATVAESKITLRRPSQEIPLGVSPELDQLYYAYNGIFSRLASDNLESVTLGARWDFRKDTALKIEYSMLRGKAGETSFFTIKDDAAFDRKANLFLIGVDWVF